MKHIGYSSQILINIWLGYCLTLTGINAMRNFHRREKWRTYRHRRTDEQTHIDGKTDGKTDRRTDTRSDWRTDRQTDRKPDRWTDKRTDEQDVFTIYKHMYIIITTLTYVSSIIFSTSLWYSNSSTKSKGKTQWTYREIYKILMYNTSI